MQLKDILRAKVIGREPIGNLIAEAESRKILVPWPELRKPDEFCLGLDMYVQLECEESDESRDGENHIDFIGKPRYKNCLVYDAKGELTVRKKVLTPRNGNVPGDIICGKVIGHYDDFVKVADLGEFVSGLVNIRYLADALGYEHKMERSEMVKWVEDYLERRSFIDPSSSLEQKKRCDLDLICESMKTGHNRKSEFACDFNYMFKFKGHLRI